MAQDISFVLQHSGAADGEQQLMVAYSDPESEVSNGLKPKRVTDNIETEADDYLDKSMEADNYPETQADNGSYPPDVDG